MQCIHLRACVPHLRMVVTPGGAKQRSYTRLSGLKYEILPPSTENFSIPFMCSALCPSTSLYPLKNQGLLLKFRCISISKRQNFDRRHSKGFPTTRYQNKRDRLIIILRTCLTHIYSLI